MRGGVRYQFYESADGHVLFMASEQAFWRNFCEGVGRVDLFQAHPGSRYASHARGNTALRRELQGIFRTRTTAEWVQFGIDSDVPIGPVNTPETIAADPQFADRLPWLDRDVLGCEQLPFPVRFLDLEVADPTKAPSLGEHTDEVLREVLGYDDETIAAKRAGGALGS
jgi:crotonobetainyl-CoA:carnitine CoA-transferase CaiB-like acyl-CoA transferase